MNEHRVVVVGAGQGGISTALALNDAGVRALVLDRADQPAAAWRGRGLEPMVGHLGVLDDRGNPRRQGGEAAAPGLRFIGYTARPAALGYMAKQAKRAAKAIASELRAVGVAS